MLMPKRVKYRKVHRGRRRGIASRGNQVSFGDFGLQALAPRVVEQPADRGGTSRHRALPASRWEAVDSCLSRSCRDETSGGNPHGRRQGQRWEFWAAVVRPGLMLFEVAGVTEEEAKAAMRVGFSQAADRRAQFVRREIGEEV